MLRSGDLHLGRLSSFPTNGVIGYMIFTDATGVQTSLLALTPQTNAPTKRNGDFLSDGIMVIIFVP
jgi:hypothetical protein